MDDAGGVFEAGGSNAVELTANIVAAYVANNSLSMAELPAFIVSVHAAMTSLGTGIEPAPAIEKPTPAQIKKSITPDGLVSFIDGRTYKTLKRHLSRHGLEAKGYRERYGLPADYPMVAAAYSARRSDLARSIGLGQIRWKGPAAPEPQPVPVPAEPKKRGRGKAQAAE